MTFRVVCTDRGQHPQRYIRRDVARELEDYHHNWDAPPGAARTERRPDGGVTYVFHCRTCGRHEELRDDTLHALQADLGDAGVSQLDISHLTI